MLGRRVKLLLSVFVAFSTSSVFSAGLVVWMLKRHEDANVISDSVADNGRVVELDALRLAAVRKAAMPQ